MKNIVLAVSVLILFFTACNNLSLEPVALLKPVPFDSLPSPEIEPVYPVPPGTIQDWQESELVMFIHFGMNTFVDSGFGTGGEPPTQFDPPLYKCEAVGIGGERSRVQIPDTHGETPRWILPVALKIYRLHNSPQQL